MIVSKIGDAMREKVEAVIDEIRPMIQSDGGDIELVEIKDDVVTVRLKGACVGCPSSAMTLSMGVESRIKEVCPEVKSVIAI
jgi:Fe-S cluster biogenesis protein NfuA